MGTRRSGLVGRFLWGSLPLARTPPPYPRQIGAGSEACSEPAPIDLPSCLRAVRGGCETTFGWVRAGERGYHPAHRDRTDASIATPDAIQNIDDCRGVALRDILIVRCECGKHLDGSRGLGLTGESSVHNLASRCPRRLEFHSDRVLLFIQRYDAVESHVLVFSESSNNALAGLFVVTKLPRGDREHGVGVRAGRHSCGQSGLLNLRMSLTVNVLARASACQRAHYCHRTQHYRPHSLTLPRPLTSGAVYRAR
jgi:hypothetical protein